MRAGTENHFACLVHLFLVWQRNPEVLHISPIIMRRLMSLQLSDFLRLAENMVLTANSY